MSDTDAHPPQQPRATLGALAPLSLLALAALAGIARAQCQDSNPCTCAPPKPEGVYYAGGGGGISTYTPLREPPFTPDRRPGFVLHMNCTDCRDCDNPLAQSPWWQSAEWSGVRSLLDNARARGFHRIMLYKPGGALGTQKIQQAQYGYLTDDQKSLLNNQLADWLFNAKIDDPDFDLGVFMGSWQGGSPCTPCIADNSGNRFWDCRDDDDRYHFDYNRRFFDPTDPASMNETYQNLKPWMDIGCTSFWMDNSADKVYDDVGDYPGPDRLIDLLQSPDYDNKVKFVGEAIPSFPDGYMQPVPVHHAAWFCHLQYLMGDDDGNPKGKGWLTGGSHADQVVDPVGTELNVLFADPDGAGDGPPYTIDTMADARDRGYIVWAAAEEAVPMLQRLYDGEDDAFYLDCQSTLADFNGDGAIDCTDYLQFLRNWLANLNAPRHPDLAIWDGDINNDDTVDFRDFLLFISLADWNAMHCL